MSGAGFVLWFTGLSGAGKSTLTAIVAAELRRRGVHVEPLDGDEIRKNLSKGLGFSKEDRDANIRRLGFVAKLIARSGGCAITAAISPYREVRDEVRRGATRFCEVFCDCPVDVLAERDPKGLYKKALRGEIKNFTGVDDPYEPPLAPEVHLHTNLETPEQSAVRVLARLEELGFVPRAQQPAAGAVPSLISPHGGELQDRLLVGEEAEAELKRARSLETVTLSRESEAWLAGLASGALSPLTGFMGEKDYLRVVSAERLERGLFWPTPVLLRLTADVKVPAAGASVALAAGDGRLLATLAVSEVWQLVQGGERTTCLAGDVKALASPGWCEPALTARVARSRLLERGQLNATALGSSVVPSLADEYVARAALELRDALLVLVLAEPRSPTPVSVRLRAWQALAEGYFPSERVLCASSALPELPASAWASLVAIVAQNFGAARVLLPRSSAPSAGVSELQIGRDYHDAASFSTRLGGFATDRTSPRPLPVPVRIDSAAAALATPELFRPEVLDAIR